MEVLLRKLHANTDISISGQIYAFCVLSNEKYEEEEIKNFENVDLTFS
jgi:hypothetical protein